MWWFVIPLGGLGVGLSAYAGYLGWREDVRAWNEERTDREEELRRKDEEVQRREAEAFQRREDALAQREWAARRDEEKLREKLLFEDAQRLKENAVRGRRYRVLVGARVSLVLKDPETTLVGKLAGAGRKGIALEWDAAGGRRCVFPWEHVKALVPVPEEEKETPTPAPASEIDPDILPDELSEGE